MSDEPPADLTLRRLRSIDRKLERIQQDVFDLSARVLALEHDMHAVGGHRVRHEERLAELHAMLERVVRRGEVVDDGSDDDT